MSKGRVFDIEEAQWTQESKGVRYCVFQASEKATVQYYEITASATTSLMERYTPSTTACGAGFPLTHPIR